MADSLTRTRQLIDSLHLQPHPEGGYFGEVFRSSKRISVVDSMGIDVERNAMSTIYFLLTHPEYSCWHIVDWDEIWHFYEGQPAELLTVDPDEMVLRRRILGPLSEGQEPVLSVLAGHWQAARPITGFTLAGCTVGPGFEFSDMRLLRDHAEVAARIEQNFPAVADLL